MSSINRYKSLVGVMTNGNGTARVDATIAELRAKQALEIATQALGVAGQLENTSDKLNDEIKRSVSKDAEQEQAIKNLDSRLFFDIEFDDLLPESTDWNVIFDDKASFDSTFNGLSANDTIWEES